MGIVRFLSDRYNKTDSRIVKAVLFVALAVVVVILGLSTVVSALGNAVVLADLRNSNSTTAHVAARILSNIPPSAWPWWVDALLTGIAIVSLGLATVLHFKKHNDRFALGAEPAPADTPTPSSSNPLSERLAKRDIERTIEEAGQPKSLGREQFDEIIESPRPTSPKPAPRATQKPPVQAVRGSVPQFPGVATDALRALSKTPQGHAMGEVLARMEIRQQIAQRASDLREVVMEGRRESFKREHGDEEALSIETSEEAAMGSYYDEHQEYVINILLMLKETYNLENKGLNNLVAKPNTSEDLLDIASGLNALSEQV